MRRSAIVGHHESGDRIKRQELAKSCLAREVHTARILYPGSDPLGVFSLGGYTRNHQAAFGQSAQEAFAEKRKVIDGPLSQWKNIRGIGVHQNDHFLPSTVQASGGEFLTQVLNVERF